jgi:hypothetical protein
MKEAMMPDVGKLLPTNIQERDYIMTCTHETIKRDILGRAFYHLVFMLDRYLYNDMNGWSGCTHSN